MATPDDLANFGWNLYKTQPNNSVFLSPVSISLALSMVYLGSFGDIKTEMNQVMFGNASEPRAILASLRMLTDSLQSVYGKYGTVVFHVANRLYISDKGNVLASYKRALRTHVNASIKSVDFLKSAQACKKINQFVSNQTDGKIGQVVDQLDELTRLVMVNAIYFKAQWGTEFFKGYTKKRKFYPGGKCSVTVDMMKSRGDYLYYESPTSQVLGMLYTNNKHAMFVILPRRRNGLSALEKFLSGKILLDTFANATFEEVLVTLPKFKFEKEIDLDGPLQRIGLRSLFDRTKANLSGIDPTENLHISRAIHKTFISVDEEGTEAAGVTAVLIENDSARIRERTYKFVANHPFIFAIVDMERELLLFLGRYTEFCK